MRWRIERQNWYSDSSNRISEKIFMFGDDCALKEWSQREEKWNVIKQFHPKKFVSVIEQPNHD